MYFFFSLKCVGKNETCVWITIFRVIWGQFAIFMFSSGRPSKKYICLEEAKKSLHTWILAFLSLTSLASKNVLLPGKKVFEENLWIKVCTDRQKKVFFRPRALVKYGKDFLGKPFLLRNAEYSRGYFFDSSGFRVPQKFYSLECDQYNPLCSRTITNAMGFRKVARFLVH